jgi:HSP20 family protein
MEEKVMLPVRVEKRRTPLNRWLDPLDMDLLTNFDRVVDRFFGPQDGRFGVLPADVWEDENNIMLELELPGLKPEEVNVSFEDGLLRIEGERKEPEHKGETYISERVYGKFSRTFQLPKVIDPQTMQANFHDGVLVVTCPKKPETRPKKIEIKAT